MDDFFYIAAYPWSESAYFKENGVDYIILSKDGQPLPTKNLPDTPHKPEMLAVYRDLSDGKIESQDDYFIKNVTCKAIGNEDDILFCYKIMAK